MHTAPPTLGGDSAANGAHEILTRPVYFEAACKPVLKLIRKSEMSGTAWAPGKQGGVGVRGIKNDNKVMKSVWC